MRRSALVPAVAQEPGAILKTELLDLLRQRNGFYAFEMALHVYPAGAVAEGYDLQAWNSPGLWRHKYRDAADGLLFFAQDVFGVQSCLDGEHVSTFDPETAERTRVSDSIEAWARWVLDDWRVTTGWPLAHEWQERFGPLAAGCRLSPKLPFVLGGEFVVENLYATDAVEAMRGYADIGMRMRHLRDGTRVRLKVVE